MKINLFKGQEVKLDKKEFGVICSKDGKCVVAPIKETTNKSNRQN